ncbi:MAG: DUF3658 domain-containing protein [Flavipsychrobacter sp.]|nr:DUF3658 domain-containing protein [Flavipsychrobacter sp.]
MIYHIVVGDLAAVPLKEAIAQDPSMAGEVVVLKDILNVGPILKEDGVPFSNTRTAFWQQVIPAEKDKIQVDDMERILDLSHAMYKNDKLVAWFWMAPIPADVCAYHWVLPYLSKHKEHFYIVNIANLPFLDVQGKVFYPKSLSEVIPKEIIKARKLARLVTPSEVEIDGDEWQKLVKENKGIRTHEGGKKLSSKDENYYDSQLISFCSQQYQKAARIVTQALTKFSIPTGDLYLGWRLRQMAAAGLVQIKGDETKSIKDFDVKMPGGEAEPAQA